MDQRNRLFSSSRGGQSPAPGLPGRQVQRPPPGGGDMGYAPGPRPSDPSSYDPSRSSYGNYGMPSPGRPPAGGPGAFPSPSPSAPSQARYYDKPPQQPPSTSASRGRPVRLRLQKVADKSLQERYIFGNLCAVSPNDFPPSRDGSDIPIRVTRGPGTGDFVVMGRPTPGFPDGCISMSDPQRTWCGIGLLDEVFGEVYDPFRTGAPAYVGSLDLEVGFASKNKTVDTAYDQDQLADVFVQTFQNQILAPRQKILMDVGNVPLLITVQTVTLVDLAAMTENAAATRTDPDARGILTNQTSISFYKNATSPIKLKGSSRRAAANAIIAPDFKFEDMGIGGLDAEFSTIFRRAFASRIFPPGLIDKLGIMHVKGMLLYGPPGTGKTLIARQIGRMLNAREPKVINGPEVLNKYVGQSEENIRKLFADAEKEYREKGDESGLHIIIFDELDAVCKQRGSGAGGGTGVGDSVVNQLLSKLDGVDQLNNILLIGMTNRKDMIDDALLRPGRLEVQIEISLPDEKGRQQILKIHTAKMRENDIMAGDVRIEELAALTKNFSGAELSGLVKSATSFAFNRHIKVGTMAGVADDVAHMKVNRADFLNALTEVKPAFGVADEELAEALVYGVIHFGPRVQQIIDDGLVYVENVRQAERLKRLAVLLHGPPGSGKTALAAHIAMRSEFPFVKLVTPQALVGFRDEVAKKDYLHRVFTDAYKSPLSVLILDNIERLVEWNPVGPRLSNVLLQALMTLVQAPPPKGHRLLILATTSQRGVMDQLDVTQAFDSEIPVPAVRDLGELATVLRDAEVFGSAEEAERAVGAVAEYNGGSEAVGVGIKTVLTLAESARLAGGDPGRWFAEQLYGQIQRYNPRV